MIICFVRNTTPAYFLHFTRIYSDVCYIVFERVSLKTFFPPSKFNMCYKVWILKIKKNDFKYHMYLCTVYCHKYT